MRLSECDLLIVPGPHSAEEDHWQSRWENRLSTASRAIEIDWLNPDPATWTTELQKSISAAKRPVVLVAHSLGVLAVARAAPHLPTGKVAGAFLVAGPDTNVTSSALPALEYFSPMPKNPLPFPALLIASRNDPHCSFERAQAIANEWGVTLVDAGEVGHIDAESGHGPWPEGLMRLGHFLGQLGSL